MQTFLKLKDVLHIFIDIYNFMHKHWQAFTYPIVSKFFLNFNILCVFNGKVSISLSYGLDIIFFTDTWTNKSNFGINKETEHTRIL